MTRQKPKSTLDDLMLFTVIAMVFTRMAFREGLHILVQLVFVFVFLILAGLKLRGDKKAGRPMGKAFFIFGISLAATTALAYAIADTYLMEHGT